MKRICIRVATELEIREFMGKGREIFLMKNSGKFLKNCQSQRKIKLVCKCLKIVEIAPFISKVCQRIRVKAVSDNTIFAHDCLRFASLGVVRNLTQSCAIGWNLI